MIFKLVIALAVLVILAAGAVLVFRSGVKVGEARVRRRNGAINLQTYHEMADFVRTVLGPQDLDNIIIIPDSLRKEGSKILLKIGTVRRAIR